MFLLLAVMIGCFAVPSATLSRVRVLVPDAVLTGDSAQFSCAYDMEADSLYSVKWYKGRQEFFRFTPMETPSVKKFPIPGLPQLRISEVGRSNNLITQVTLLNVTPELSGRYSCEVSADAPSFQTALVTGKMDVVTPPKKPPNLEGLRPKYRVGDTLRVDCTSADSWPAANLSWLINGHQVDKRHASIYNVVQESGVGINMETSMSILEKVLVQQDFNSNSRMKIRCTASILSVYWKTTEKSAELYRPKDHKKEHQSQPSILLNLKNDVEAVSDIVEHEPTRVTVSLASGAPTLSHLLSLTLLSWRTLTFQYSLTLT